MVIPASGIAAVVIGWMLVTGDKPWLTLPGLGVVLVAGGILAGTHADPPLSHRRFRIYMLMPLPTIMLILLVMVGWGGLQAAPREVSVGLVALTGLWEVPLFVTLLIRSRAEQRERAEQLRLRVPFGPQPLEGELAKATRNSRSPTVIREYIDDQLGQKQLDKDKASLLPHGYELISVEAKQGRVGLHRDLGELFDLLVSWQMPGNAEANNDRIVATFQRRPK